MVTRSCLLKTQVYSFKTKSITHFMPMLSKISITLISGWPPVNYQSMLPKQNLLFRSTKSKTPPSGQSISLRKLDVEQVSSLKFRGVHIDKHLTWSVHAKHVLNKLISGLVAMRRVKPFLNQGSLITLYHSLIGIHLQNCISSWNYGNTTITNKKIANVSIGLLGIKVWCSPGISKLNKNYS